MLAMKVLLVQSYLGQVAISQFTLWGLLISTALYHKGRYRTNI